MGLSLYQSLWLFQGVLLWLDWVLLWIENLSRGALPTRNCTMNGAIMAGSICCFSCEKQRVLNGRTECLLATFATHFYVTVGALRKGIGVPVVKIGGGKLRLDSRLFDMQKAA
jgi:hypothetical protein